MKDAVAVGALARSSSRRLLGGVRCAALFVLACGASPAVGPHESTLPTAARAAEAGRSNGAATARGGRCEAVKQARRLHVGVGPKMSLDDFNDAAYEAEHILSYVRVALCDGAALEARLGHEFLAAQENAGLEIVEILFTNDEMTRADVMLRERTVEGPLWRLGLEQLETAGGEPEWSMCSVVRE